MHERIKELDYGSAFRHGGHQARNISPSHFPFGALMCRCRQVYPCAMVFVMSEAIPDCKPYLDYLDKEMTLLGVLSTFCVGFASIVLDRIVINLDKVTFFKTLWEEHITSVLAGSVLLLLAAWIFYKQRSD